MSDFSRDELKTLVGEQIPPCVSVYMSTYEETLRPLQSPLRLKNQLREAEDRLRDMHVRRPQAEAILEPARDLLDDGTFWQGSREGLAIFCSASPDAFRYYDDTSSAIQLTDLVVVGTRFHVRPLLPLLTGDGQFYVLSLSRNHVGLLKGSREQIRPIGLQGVPQSVEEALGEEIPGRARQGRAMNVGGGEQTGVFGGYDPSGAEKDQLQRYCYVVDKALRRYLADHQEPLILAAQKYLIPMYREANTYPYLADEAIPVETETKTALELRDTAWAIFEPRFQQKRDAALEQYRMYGNTEGISHKLADIIGAAHYGRVATLFIAEGKRQYGSFDPRTGHLATHSGPRLDNTDLLDEAAAQTVLNGGQVYTLRPEQMPNRLSPVAAVFRY